MLFKRCLTKAIIIFFVGTLFVFSRPAQAARPLKDILSFQDFVSLIQFNSARIPDLIPLWQWSKGNNHQQEIFWGGGTLRGFLHWHYIQLQNYTPEEIKKMPIPGLAQLQLAGGYDVDIVGPYSLKKSVLKEATPHISNVDYISESHFKELVDIGGPTIEKIKISPFVVSDPLQGLLHYYQGRLVFVSVPEDIFRKIPLYVNEDYSKTAEGERFIRFSYNIPEVTPDLQSIEDIRQINPAEIQYLKDRYRKYWVIANLQKLAISMNNNIPEILKVLKNYNILSALAEMKVWGPAPKELSEYIIDGSLDLKYFSLKDLKDALSVVRKPEGRSYYRFLEAVLPHIASAQDFLTLIELDTPEREKLWGPYRDQWVRKNFPAFISLGATSDQILSLKENVNLDNSNSVHRTIQNLWITCGEALRGLRPG